LAEAHALQGEARKAHGRLAQRADDTKPPNEGPRRLRAEAAKLPGIEQWRFGVFL
jgi:hypothetical protein